MEKEKLKKVIKTLNNAINYDDYNDDDLTTEGLREQLVICYNELTKILTGEYVEKEELQALQKLIDDSGDELPEKKRGVIAILDKEGKKYYSEKQLPDGAYNQAIDQSIPVFAKLKQENESLKEQLCIIGGERDIKAQAVDEAKEMMEKIFNERVKYQDIVYKICQLFDNGDQRFTTIDTVVEKVEKLKARLE